MGRESGETTVDLTGAAVLVAAAGLWWGGGLHPAVAWLAAVNVGTAFLFWSDKRRAHSSEWRISEKALLLFSFLGGWPAGLAASQILRHKTSKGSFRGKFWGAVVLNILLVAGAAAGFFAWGGRNSGTGAGVARIEYSEASRTEP